jgi:hypothetical protein
MTVLLLVTIIGGLFGFVGWSVHKDNVAARAAQEARKRAIDELPPKWRSFLRTEHVRLRSATFYHHSDKALSALLQDKDLPKLTPEQVELIFRELDWWREETILRYLRDQIE